ncbi:hypothetical protein CJF32_00005803 [Rutstroemia sp. NJR-2017a WRK4]|nr:hypothetical protein CJF32_00005803 [Rutstroemia sp. NJR-2017a WRK4]
MDLSDGDSDAVDMAALMGFSSFGSQNPPAKKRKFNPSTDAFVSGEELEKIDRGGKKGQGSGGNNVPLGKMRTIGVKSERRNEEEIDLDDEDEETAVGGASLEEEGKREGEEDEEGPNYIDTSAPAPLEAQAQDQQPNPQHAEMQAKIDSILNSIPPAQNVIAEVPNMIPLPARPQFQGTQSMAGSSRQGQRGPKGQRNDRWYEGYYDPSFNENPWARLEKEMGLQTKGIWVERH